MACQTNVQKTRWVFVLNNYDVGYNYHTHLLNHEFKVRRCVYGREVGAVAGTRHLQGYVEFWRSVRLAHCRKVLNRARWESARMSSLVNYNYCVKGKYY